MKEEMITSLKTRFAGVEENMLLSIATIVDPCFKDKFSVISLKHSKRNVGGRDTENY